MKKWLLAIFFLPLAFVCAGCGTMKMDTAIKLNPDQSGDFQLKMTVNGALVGFVAGEERDESFERWERVPSARIREYDHDDKHIFEVTIPFKKPTQLKEALGEMGYTVDFQKRSTPFTHYYEASFAYPKEMVKELKSSLDAAEEPNEIFSQAELNNMINSMFSFKASISLPGEIKTTNATVVDGQVASWTQRLQQLDSTKILKVSSQEPNRLGLTVTIGAVLLVSAFVIGGIKKARSPEPPEL